MGDQHFSENFSAYVRTSSRFLATLTPPALPRPPAWICALTTVQREPSFGSFHRFIHRKSDSAFGNGYTILPENSSELPW